MRMKTLPKKLFVVINPEIVEASEEKVEGIEACLSVPQMAGEVERHEQIVVKGLNRHGKADQDQGQRAGWRASSSMRSTTWMASCSPTGPSASGGRRKTKRSRMKSRNELYCPCI